MTRTEAIAQITADLGHMPDDRVAALAALVKSWSHPTVFSTLSPTQRAELDAALDSLDRGEGIDYETTRSDIDAMLKAAGV